MGQTISSIHLKGSIDKSVVDLSKIKTLLIHNDLHGGNIFYDGQSIYLIDNEEFARSIQNPTNVSSDLRSILFQTTYLHVLFFATEQNTATQRKELFDFTKCFFKGYTSNLKGINFSEYLYSFIDQSSSKLCQIDTNEPLLPLEEREKLVTELKQYVITDLISTKNTYLFQQESAPGNLVDTQNSTDTTSTIPSMKSGEQIQSLQLVEIIGDHVILTTNWDIPGYFV